VSDDVSDVSPADIRHGEDSQSLNVGPEWLKGVSKTRGRMMSTYVLLTDAAEEENFDHGQEGVDAILVDIVESLHPAILEDLICCQ